MSIDKLQDFQKAHGVTFVQHNIPSKLKHVLAKFKILLKHNKDKKVATLCLQETFVPLEVL
jgi:hypothetical protein